MARTDQHAPHQRNFPGFTHALGRLESSERQMQLLDYTPDYFVGNPFFYWTLFQLWDSW